MHLHVVVWLRELTSSSSTWHPILWSTARSIEQRDHFGPLRRLRRCKELKSVVSFVGATGRDMADLDVIPCSIVRSKESNVDRLQPLLAIQYEVQNKTESITETI